MTKPLLKQVVVLILAILFLSGCGSDEDAVRGDKDTPGYAATMYFDALYNQKNLNAAMEISTPRHARIMRSYGTASQFARNLVNMQYDEVTIEVDMTNQSLREQYGNTAKINLIFTGQLHGEQVDDMRSVSMVRKKGKWYVDKVLADPFAR
ncbi:hypothetical protein HUZ36_01395 [Pseudoalteromonas sp. McH1-7]|uniref:DUF4878 domain-containing protein n=1 Tax=Pseudoalteromonas peptidolytica F12-50-A1 TaxID=1315280 RepID=A0A8I0MWX8_9GAMM|nr:MULTISPECIES: hypothetical protein [Pseudoalteromonas]MBE0346705.1 hypothetical protein [Pseudoalteromonas peptidolytica F12-50-A1]MDW7549884.1 hypothetical protein [Pseudoalteromonas peptidolytica]NLR13617.1 hypothetical protein [Pseudoalteromonas peptidolytica]NUZ09424.1 hypothetical protein [Pseudoalteromonas sp. McH1-7]USD29782.1 hypothetical protein J8Z24_06745 [Pseudoalteromonas sp. SCSIO 43201]